jgi:hypothetical protein
MIMELWKHRYNMKLKMISLFIFKSVKSTSDSLNYHTASLNSHAQQFQYTWRDYSFILLLVIVIGDCILIYCSAAVVCIYRRLLIELVHRSIPPHTDRSSGSPLCMPSHNNRVHRSFLNDSTQLWI